MTGFLNGVGEGRAGGGQLLVAQASRLWFSPFKLPSQFSSPGSTGILPVLHRLEACAPELWAMGRKAGDRGKGPRHPEARASSPWDSPSSQNSPATNPVKRPAVFLDRDGTVNEEMGYINHLSRFRLLPEAGPAIRRLNEAGLPVVVVTNQSGAARGYFPATLVDEVHRHLHDLLAQAGARVDAIYTCLHGPEDGCSCRKPKPGLLLQAARDLNLDLSRSYLVGDRYKDIETASNAGVAGVLVLTGYGLGEYEHFHEPGQPKPVHVAANLLDAVDFILAHHMKEAQ